MGKPASPDSCRTEVDGNVPPSERRPLADLRPTTTGTTRPARSRTAELLRCDPEQVSKSEVRSQTDECLAARCGP